MVKEQYKNLYLDKGITIALVGNDKTLLLQKANFLIQKDIHDKKNLQTENVLNIKPENGNIGIDEVKKAYDFFLHKPITGNKKYLLINEVEKFTIPGANSFLKILEEPPEFITIILTSTSWENVIETIRSRSLVYNIKFPYEKLEDLKHIYLHDIKYVYSLCYGDFKILSYFLEENRKDFICRIKKLQDIKRTSIFSYLNNTEDNIQEIIIKKAAMERIFFEIVVSHKISNNVDYIYSGIKRENLFDFLIELSKLTRDVLSDFILYNTVRRSDLKIYKNMTEDKISFSQENLSTKDILWCDEIAKMKVSSFNKKLILFRLINIITSCLKGEKQNA